MNSAKYGGSPPKAVVMMPRNALRIGFFLVGMIAALFAFTLNQRSRSHTSPAVSDPPPVNPIEFLGDQAAAPGKSLSITRKGELLDTYVCSNQDAAVAWLYDPRMGSDERDTPYIVRSPSLKNLQIKLMRRHKGHVIRFRMLRGYAEKPQKVDILILSLGAARRRFNFTLAHFADPIRAIPLSSKDSIPGLSVTSTPTGSGDYRIKFQHSTPAREEDGTRESTWKDEILATSYLPRGDELPFEPEIGQETDHVLVKSTEYHLNEAVVPLIYQNASIVSVNGHRHLKLPTSQQANDLWRAHTTIRQSSPTTLSDDEGDPPNGDILISLDRPPARDLPFAPSARVVGTSPSLEQMGLRQLRVRLAGGGYGTDLISKSENRSSRINVIPKLTVFVKVRTYQPVKTRIGIARVQHRSIKDFVQSTTSLARPQMGITKLRPWIELRLPVIGDAIHP